MTTSATSPDVPDDGYVLATEAAGQEFVAEITEAIRQRRGVGMSPLLVSTWKRKPQQNGP
jgi:hypothetical protein